MQSVKFYKGASCNQQFLCHRPTQYRLNLVYGDCCCCCFSIDSEEARRLKEHVGVQRAAGWDLWTDYDHIQEGIDLQYNV